MASIRKRNGKFQVQVRRQGQRPATKSFNVRKDAELWARQQELAADRLELTHDISSIKTMTVGHLVDRYLKEVTPLKKSASAERYVLSAFRTKPICSKRLTDIRQADFAEYRDQRLTSIKPASLRRELNPIQNMFEIARDEWGLPIKENPLSKLKLKAIDNKRERRLREGELERLLEAGSRMRNPLILNVALFALQTAMRRGEILALTLGLVDLQRRSVTILESKNGYSRTIPLTAKALELLHSCTVASEEGEHRKTNDRIFKITPNALRLGWERLCRKAGIEDLHFHDLRHEAISRLFEIGLTVPEVASISGHRDVRMLFRYAHASDGGNQIVRSRLSIYSNTSSIFVSKS
jgi:integrase